MRLIFLIATIITIAANPDFARAQSSDVGEFQINGDNPHYFVYKGRPMILITDAYNLDVGGVGSEFNHRTIINITATGRPNMLYNNQNLGDGWNQSSWDNLRSVVSNANNRDAIIGIMFWSTPMVEGGERRWGTHLWNSRNGGPIPDDGDGKGEFYTLAKHQEEIGGSYEDLEARADENGQIEGIDLWVWQNQFRQEELVRKFLTEMAEFPNVYYIPMFEIGDLHGSSEAQAHQWHQHIAGIIKKYQPNRLIATVASTLDEKDIAGWPEVDFLLFEGPAISYVGVSQELRDNYWSYNKPLVWQFHHEDDGANSNVLTKMKNALVFGLHPSSRIRDGEQDGYAATLKSFLATVETLCDEPGQEITDSTIPSISGGSGVDLPPGSCSDSGGSDDGGDNTAPSPPQSVKVEN